MNRCRDRRRCGRHFFQGVKFLFTNWRLTLVQILPAMWIWAAMLDPKAHALHGKEFHILRGPLLWLILLVIAALSAGAVVCTPPFALGRVAILLLGSHPFRYLAILLLIIAVLLQTGATSSVKAIKMSAKLAVGKDPKEGAGAPEPEPAATTLSDSVRG